MVDVVAVDHVSIGTDQQVAPGSLQDYSQWAQLVAAMLRGGFTPEEAGKIAGGNYMRIFYAAVGRELIELRSMLWLLPAAQRQFALVGANGQCICVDPTSTLILVQTAVDNTEEVWQLWSALVEQFG